MVAVTVTEIPAPVGEERLIVQARQGSSDAMGELLETCRNYLLAVGNRQLATDLRIKVAASDLVQETFLEAQRDFHQFPGHTHPELLAWLSNILFNNLLNQMRRYRGTEKRQLSREVPLDDLSPVESQDGDLCSNTPTPSGCVMAREEAQAVVDAMARLPERYRLAILLRNQLGLSLPEMGQQLGCSPEAARKLWARAVERLQQELDRADATL